MPCHNVVGRRTEFGEKSDADDNIKLKTISEGAPSNFVKIVADRFQRRRPSYVLIGSEALEIVAKLTTDKVGQIAFDVFKPNFCSHVAMPNFRALRKIAPSPDLCESDA
jgi:hypothetical protein